MLRFARQIVVGKGWKYLESGIQLFHIRRPSESCLEAMTLEHCPEVIRGIASDAGFPQRVEDVSLGFFEAHF